jgi:hypothetical protein
MRTSSSILAGEPRENPGVWRWYFYRKSFWRIAGARRRGLAFGVTALGV